MVFSSTKGEEAQPCLPGKNTLQSQAKPVGGKKLCIKIKKAEHKALLFNTKIQKTTCPN